MNVEYTGRHYEITTSVRDEIENGLLKIRKILRDKFETKVVLTIEKRRNKAEITRVFSRGVPQANCRINSQKFPFSRRPLRFNFNCAVFTRPSQSTRKAGAAARRSY